MTIVILADFKTNNKHTELAQKTLKRLDGLAIEPMCLTAPSYSLLNKATVVVQFLAPEKLIRIPNKTNIAVGTHEELGQYAEIVDYVWDDYPVLIELNQNTINIPHLNGEYVFYTINDNYDKSNTRMIIQAFNEEFDPAEPVNLVIKTNRIIDKEMVEIKTSIGKFKDINVYKKNVVISKDYTEEDIWALHNSFDCYVESEDNPKMYQYIRSLDKGSMFTLGCSLDRIKYNMRDCYNVKYKSEDCEFKQEDLNNYFFEKLGELNG